MEYVEVTEEYENGVLIKRKYNGIEQPLPNFEQCKSVIFVQVLSKEDAERRYGNFYKIPN